MQKFPEIRICHTPTPCTWLARIRWTCTVLNDTCHIYKSNPGRRDQEWTYWSVACGSRFAPRKYRCHILGFCICKIVVERERSQEQIVTINVINVEHNIRIIVIVVEHIMRIIVIVVEHIVITIIVIVFEHIVAIIAIVVEHIVRIIVLVVEHIVTIKVIIFQHIVKI